jgi:hypothetical protein
MIPGLETLLGSVLGGAFRLGQAVLDAREKQRDRDQEFRMTGLNGELAEKADERRMKLVGLEGEIKYDADELAAVERVSLSQASEASQAGGFVAAMSASVRPVVTYMLLALYIAVKLAGIIYAWPIDGMLTAIMGAYTESDSAILSSILAFWFVDRSLRKGRSHVAS